MDHNSVQGKISEENMNRPDLSMRNISNILNAQQYMAARMGFYPYWHPYPVYGGYNYSENNRNLIENSEIKPSKNTKLNPSKAKCIWKAK